MTEEKRPCLSCGSPILSGALKCRFCGAMQAEVVGPAPVQAPSKEEENLKLLSILHYVYAAMKAFMSCIPLIWVLMGVIFVFAAQDASEKDAPPAVVGFVMMAFGLVFSLIGWGLAACIFYAGRFISQRRRILFCQVVAAICCIFPPLGTALGIFTLIVLAKEPVQALFKKDPRGGV